MRPPAKLLRTLAEAQSRIFGTTPPQPEGTPSNLRTGAKYLRRRLVGPSMLNYYPPRVSLQPLSKMLYGPGGPLENEAWKAPDGTIRRHVAEPLELQRLEDVERKKALGRGKPKKGEGRRAAMKAGKKR